MRKRKGRKRKIAARYPSGAIAHARVGPDRGTPELRARRRFLAQDGDSAKTSYPLGVLWTNAQISDDEHRVACRFAWLYAMVFGRVSLAAASYEQARLRAAQGDDTSAQAVYRASAERELSGMLSALTGLSVEHRDSVLNVCVFEQAPPWLLPKVPTVQDVAAAEKFIKGIQCLSMTAKSRPRKPIKA